MARTMKLSLQAPHALCPKHNEGRRPGVSCFLNCLPAEVLVRSLLVGGHEIHELQAGALVGRTEKRAAVAMDASHPLER